MAPFIKWGAGATLSLILVSVIAYLPLIIIAVSFRFAIKSTALLWCPLLWIIYQSRPGERVLKRIEVGIRQPWMKFVLVYSLFVMAAFMLKMGVIFHLWTFLEITRLGSLGGLAMRLVAPFDLPLWQMASAMNAGMAWAFFFRAKRHLLANNSTEAWPEAWIEREYVGFQGIRTTLSLYAIACTFYIAAATAWQTEWPPIHLILFPWAASSGS
jgi:hypothetical protein